MLHISQLTCIFIHFFQGTVIKNFIILLIKNSFEHDYYIWYYLLSILRTYWSSCLDMEDTFFFQVERKERNNLFLILMGFKQTVLNPQ